jgi:hypothetical protein
MDGLDQDLLTPRADFATAMQHMDTMELLPSLPDPMSMGVTFLMN